MKLTLLKLLFKKELQILLKDNTKDATGNYANGWRDCLNSIKSQLGL